MFDRATITLGIGPHSSSVLFLRAAVQPTLDPRAAAFCNQAHALAQEGESLVNGVCECMRD